MNTTFITLLMQNHFAFIDVFIIEPLPAALLTYAYVWWSQHKNNKLEKVLSWKNIVGFALTLLFSSVIRIVSIITFAGRSAYELSSDNVQIAVFYIVIPAIVSYTYLKLCNKINDTNADIDAKQRTNLIRNFITNYGPTIVIFTLIYIALRNGII